MKCSICGFENSDSAKFCSSCGARLEHQDQPIGAPVSPQQPDQTTPAGNADGLKWYQKTWVIVLFLVFIWPVGIVFVFLSPWKKNAKVIVAIAVTVLAIFLMSFARGFLATVNTTSSTSQQTISSASQQASFYGLSYNVDPSWQESDDAATASRTYTIDANNVIYLQASDYTGYDIPASMDYLIENSQSALASTYDITASVTSQKMTLGSYSACRLDWKMNDSSGVERTMTEYLVFFNDYVVTVTFGGPTSTYSSMSTQFTAFANSLSAGGSGTFATISGTGSQSGLVASGSTATGTGTGSSTATGTGTGSSTTTNPYEAKATAFRNSLPSYCALTDAASMNTTDPEDALASVYFYGYSDSSQSTVLCYGTYFVVDSSSTATADFDEGVQLSYDNGAPEGNLIKGDDKSLWTCTWNGTYCYMYQKANIVLTLAGTEDSMEYIQTLASQLAL